MIIGSSNKGSFPKLEVPYNKSIIYQHINQLKIAKNPSLFCFNTSEQIWIFTGDFFISRSPVPQPKGLRDAMATSTKNLEERDLDRLTNFIFAPCLGGLDPQKKPQKGVEWLGEQNTYVYIYICIYIYTHKTHIIYIYIYTH